MLKTIFGKVLPHWREEGSRAKILVKLLTAAGSGYCMTIYSYVYSRQYMHTRSYRGRRLLMEQYIAIGQPVIINGGWLTFYILTLRYPRVKSAAWTETEFFVDASTHISHGNSSS